MSRSLLLSALAAAGAIVCACPAGDDPFADAVVSYAPGSNPAAGYTTPAVALGPPERFTGEGFEPSVVSMLNPAWRPHELVSIGTGGELVLRFDTPVTDDPLNPWGIDLLVFGNALFVEGAGGAIAAPGAVFDEGGCIEVSADGTAWTAVEGVSADGLFPTEGYLDLTDPHDPQPGAVESNFTRPVNPALGATDFGGLPYTEAVRLYAGSGGGAGIDLAPLGLAAISYVRISNDGPDSPEVDAVADVAPRVPGDATGDGVVDALDALEVIANWGTTSPAGWDADFNSDGAVDALDWLEMIANWS
jgi:hypothetical protein